MASGIEEILVITGRNKRAIEDHFDKSVELEKELENSERRALQMAQKYQIWPIYIILDKKEPRGLDML